MKKVSILECFKFGAVRNHKTLGDYVEMCL